MPKIVPVSWRRLAKVFELDGWKLSRIRGDHLVLTKPGYPRPVIIPRDNQVEIFIIQNNLKTAKISRERYFELLKKTS